MKVYVVEFGEYEERRVVGVFSSRAAARAYVEWNLPLSHYADGVSEVTEWVLDEPRAGPWREPK